MKIIMIIEKKMGRPREQHKVRCVETVNAQSEGVLAIAEV